MLKLIMGGLVLVLAMGCSEGAKPPVEPKILSGPDQPKGMGVATPSVGGKGSAAPAPKAQ